METLDSKGIKRRVAGRMLSLPMDNVSAPLHSADCRDIAQRKDETCTDELAELGQCESGQECRCASTEPGLVSEERQQRR